MIAPYCEGLIALCLPFSTMPPQVYEHVYETVDINSSPEVRANATAKVTPHLTSVFIYNCWS